MENLYHDFGEWPAFLPFALWYGNLAARLRRGEQPTAADTRLRDELITRLRCALPGAAP